MIPCWEQRFPGTLANSPPSTRIKFPGLRPGTKSRWKRKGSTHNQRDRHHYRGIRRRWHSGRSKALDHLRVAISDGRKLREVDFFLPALTRLGTTFPHASAFRMRRTDDAVESRA